MLCKRIPTLVWIIHTFCWFCRGVVIDDDAKMKTKILKKVILKWHRGRKRKYDDNDGDDDDDDDDDKRGGV